MAVLVHEVVEIRIFVILILIIYHTAQNVLRMSTEVRAVTVKASHKIAREMRDRNYTRVIIRVRGGTV